MERLGYSKNYSITLKIIAYFIWTEQVEVIVIPLTANFYFLKKGYNILEWISVFIKDVFEISEFLLNYSFTSSKDGWLIDNNC